LKVIAVLLFIFESCLHFFSIEYRQALNRKDEWYIVTIISKLYNINGVQSQVLIREPSVHRSLPFRIHKHTCLVQ
jgi:hypothetical protein